MARRRGMPVAAATLVLLLGACTDSPPAQQPTTPGSVTATGYGTRYALPAAMCDAIDLSPLTELYPGQEPDAPLAVNTESRCDTTLHNGGRALGVSLFVLLQEEELLALDPTLTRQHYEGQLVRAMFPATQLDGVGAGAFWYGDGNNELWLEAYDGNLNLRLYVFTLSSGDPLDASMPDRLADVATGVLAALSP